jgi:hypothetical protein
MRNVVLTMSVGSAFLFAGAALATPINYGNFNGATVMYLNVTEDSTTDPGPLFGAPTVSVDSLQFNPASFGSFAANGAVDITDGTLTTMIMARPGNFITDINISEQGDYSLIGFTGNAATSARVALAAYITVTEVNGTPVTPFTGTINGTFNPLSGVYSLANPGFTTLAQWNGGFSFDVDALVASRGLSGSATKVTLTFNNTLVTTSETNTNAFIKKKEIGGVVVTVPTPGSLALLGLGGLVALRRKR